MRQMAQVMSETYSHSTAAAMKDALSDVGRQLSQDIGASVKDAVSEPFNRLNQSMQNVSDSLSQVEKTQKNMAEVIDENTEAIEDSRKKNDDDK